MGGILSGKKFIPSVFNSTSAVPAWPSCIPYGINSRMEPERAEYGESFSSCMITGVSSINQLLS